MKLNLFYEEPDHDRWLPFDRYPRRWIRRLLRGPPRIRGQRRTFLNLRAGLERLGVPCRVNDYGHARRNPGELACIVGKPVVLDRLDWRNPILFGPAVYAHPSDDPELFSRRPVRRVLVPGEWMRRMCEPAWGDKVAAWPAGTDTERWRPAPVSAKTLDVLLYRKILWQRPAREDRLVAAILRELAARGRSVAHIRYGDYREEEFRERLGQCRAMVFLCEHETQGHAYQEALAAGVPVLAWDAGGQWEDPGYYPHRVRFGPVSSVPYWDERCGQRFQDAAGFGEAFGRFWDGVRAGRFAPRDYMLEHLTLEKCAAAYLRHCREVGG